MSKSGSYKGIVIDIGGNTTPLNSALSEVNKTSNSLKGELKEVERLLKFDPTNTELVAQKQKLLAEQVENAKTKLNYLKQAQEQVEAAFKSGKMGEAEYRAFQRQVIAAEQALNSAENAQQEFEEECKKSGKAAKEAGEDSEKAGKKAKESGEDAKKGGSGWEKFGEVASNAGKIALAGITALATAGTAAMAKLTKDSLDVRGELEQNLGGSEQVFGEYAQRMQETANNAYSSMGLSASDFLATANKMGALFQGSGFSIEESADITAKAMQRAADVASIMGIDVSSAMDAIAGAAKGNFTMMDNLGVAMNDTALQAYALSKGIEKSTSQMSQQEKIGLAMEMFLEKTAYAAGNYARENETLAGSLNTTKAAYDNFLAGTGSAEDLAKALATTINVIIEKIQDIVPQLVEGITSLIDSFIPQLPTIFDKVLPAVIDGVISLINGLNTVLPSLIKAAFRILQKVTSAVLSNTQMIIDVIMQIITEVINFIIQNLPLFINAGIQIIIALMNGIATALPQIIQAIVDMIPQLIQVITDNLPLYIQAGITLILSLVQGLIDAIPQLLEALPTIITALLDGILAAIPQLIDAGIQLLTALVTALPEIIQKIVEVLPKIIDSIITALLDNLPLIIQAGIDLLVALVKALPQIITTIVKAIPQIVNSIVDALIGNIDKIIDAGVQLFIALVTNLPKIIAEVVKAIPKIIDAIFDAFGSFTGKMADIGLNLIEGIWNGISDAGAWLWDKISGFFGDITDKIKGFFGIASPSKWMRDVIGKNLVKGIGVGVEDEIPDLQETLDKNLSSVQAGIQATLDFESSKPSMPSAANASKSLGGISISIGNFNNYDSSTDVNSLTDMIITQIEEKVRRKGAVFA